MGSNMARMQELVDILDSAGKAYYQESREIIPNIEYDRLYDELMSLEELTGVVLSKSPTHKAGYEVLSVLPKENHSEPMLSLNKTKDPEVLKNFLGTHVGILSWKLDGLTVVLTYDNGELTKAVTRGNGFVGEIITRNAHQFVNIPLKIPFKGHLVVRGEAVITYKDFDAINQSININNEFYKNPRNLCAGTVRQLDSSITAQRKVRFIAFSFISADFTKCENIDSRLKSNLYSDRFDWLSDQGFTVVEHAFVTQDNIQLVIDIFSSSIGANDIPSDGLVLLINDISYGKNLGTTDKYPKNAMAFKWKDELTETRLLEVQWSVSRTGLINPIAIFEPVTLEGTVVTRASLHNLSIVEGLELGIGDLLTVYKANMIIPQIDDNLTRSNTIMIPKQCPVCHAPVKIVKTNSTKVLKCCNDKCAIKKIKDFELFVSRDAMNIEGLSTLTLTKFIECGYIQRLSDIYYLDKYESDILVMDGFGKKSYEKLIASIDNSKSVKPEQFLNSLGIPGVGLTTAKSLAKVYGCEIDKLMEAKVCDLTRINGVGDKIANDIVAWFDNSSNSDLVNELLSIITLVEDIPMVQQTLSGMNIAISGSSTYFTNRDVFVKYIESRGGNVVDHVSRKTDILVNNDLSSKTSKNIKAKEFGIPILTEELFMSRYR